MLSVDVVRMTDEEKNKNFRDFILWQHEGLDIEKQSCLVINFGVNMKFEYSQIRRVIMIFQKNILFSKILLVTYHDIFCSMSLKDEENVTLLDPFTHTQQDSDEIRNFDFWVERQKKEEREKVKIDETFCTVVTVGGQFLKKKIFQKVLRKIYKIRRRFREYLNKIYLYVCQKEAHTYT